MLALYFDFSFPILVIRDCSNPHSTLTFADMSICQFGVWYVPESPESSVLKIAEPWAKEQGFISRIQNLYTGDINGIATILKRNFKILFFLHVFINAKESTMYLREIMSTSDFSFTTQRQIPNNYSVTYSKYIYGLSVSQDSIYCQIFYFTHSKFSSLPWLPMNFAVVQLQEKMWILS